jgi:hypothetical protein
MEDFEPGKLAQWEVLAVQPHALAHGDAVAVAPPPAPNTQ